MKEISLFFVTALQSIMKDKPKGSRAGLARAVGVDKTIISGILNGTRYGSSEETRRAIADALGWPYERLLVYGESLVHKKPFINKSPLDPSLDPKYLSLSLFSKIKRMAVKSGYAWTPVFSDERPPLIILRSILSPNNDNECLAACKMPDKSMEPTIKKGSVVVLDTAVKFPEDKKLYVFSQSVNSDKFMIRRLRVGKDKTELYLMTDGDYTPELFTVLFEEIIVGRVLWSFYPYD